MGKKKGNHIAVGRLNSYPPGFPAGRGVFGFAENIPYAEERPGAKRPVTERKFVKMLAFSRARQGY